MSAIDTKLKFEPFNVIFCDDIRREISGKDILIGVYSADIVVPSVPVIIPIALWIQVHTIGVGRVAIKIKVSDPAGNTAGQTRVEYHLGDPSAHSAAAIFPPLPISVTTPGLIKIYWATEGDDFSLIGEKNVRTGQVSTGNALPFGQSPPAAPS